MAISLLRTHTQVFTWLGDAITQGFVDKNGNWIPPVDTSDSITSYGSLQPYSTGNSRLVLPEGMREKDACLWYSTDDIRSLDDAEKLEPAVTNIRGNVYEVAKKADWTGYGLSTDHYEYLLVKQTPAE